MAEITQVDPTTAQTRYDVELITFSFARSELLPQTDSATKSAYASRFVNYVMEYGQPKDWQFLSELYISARTILSDNARKRTLRYLEKGIAAVSDGAIEAEKSKADFARALLASK